MEEGADEGVRGDGEEEREVGVGEEGAEADGECEREVGGVTGSRSVMTRMVKRGGIEMEMDGDERGDSEGEVLVEWAAGMKGGDDG